MGAVCISVCTGLQLQDVAHFIAVTETCARFLTVQNIFEKYNALSHFPELMFGFVFIFDSVLVQTGKLMFTNVIVEPEKLYYALFCSASYCFSEEARPLLSNVEVPCCYI